MTSDIVLALKRWTRNPEIGSFFMINLCLVVIATQFSETKKREMERMKMERARYHSTSTLTSSTNNSEPNSCYAEMVKTNLGSFSSVFFVVGDKASLNVVRMSSDIVYSTLDMYCFLP
ncbi:hypothetical protein WDU94_007198 [Cyamophila willieti]